MQKYLPQFRWHHYPSNYFSLKPRGPFSSLFLIPQGQSSPISSVFKIQLTSAHCQLLLRFLQQLTNCSYVFTLAPQFILYIVEQSFKNRNQIMASLPCLKLSSGFPHKLLTTLARLCISQPLTTSPPSGSPYSCPMGHTSQSSALGVLHFHFPLPRIFKCLTHSLGVAQMPPSQKGLS